MKNFVLLAFKCLGYNQIKKDELYVKVQLFKIQLKLHLEKLKFLILKFRNQVIIDNRRMILMMMYMNFYYKIM